MFICVIWRQRCMMSRVDRCVRSSRKPFHLLYINKMRLSSIVWCDVYFSGSSRAAWPSGAARNTWQRGTFRQMLRFMQMFSCMISWLDLKQYTAEFLYSHPLYRTLCVCVSTSSSSCFRPSGSSGQYWTAGSSRTERRKGKMHTLISEWIDCSFCFIHYYINSNNI